MPLDEPSTVIATVALPRDGVVIQWSYLLPFVVAALGTFFGMFD